MTRIQLIQALLTRCVYLDQATAATVVKLFFKEIIQALATGNKVILRRFGNFTLKLRPAYRAYNPHTGQKVEVEERKFVTFKASKLLLQDLNKGDNL